MATMESEILRWLINQGVAVVAFAAMFYIYRQDAQRNLTRLEASAKTYMEWGERQGAMLTRNNDHLDKMAALLANIERQLHANGVCPVSQVSRDMLERAARAGEDAPSRTEIERRLARGIRQALTRDPVQNVD